MNALKVAFDLIISQDKVLLETIGTTLYMALFSSVSALLIGVPIGILLSCARFPGKNVLVIILRTLMGLPPVVVGIVLFVLFSGTGPFGSLKLIYSVPLMIIAQIVLITPITAGMAEQHASGIFLKVFNTAKGLGLKSGKIYFLTMNECKYSVISIYLFAFARAISEVGAVQIVGGNILHKTRVMTTTIALNYNTGQFELAIALGIILLTIALLFNLTASLIVRKRK